jgi:DsbC/DsbD-like thiol-disulfide interchange protein
MQGVMRGVLHLFVVALLAQSAAPSILPAPKNVPKHLTLTTGASATSAAPGSKVSLFIDITPNPGIHVYAPGAKDYLPIAVKLEPQADVGVGKTVYPKSELMTFAGENVPVFQKPFRLVDDVTIAKTVKAGTTLTINGTVDYQACDDQVCFIPAKAPVTWSITVK